MSRRNRNTPKYSKPSTELLTKAKKLVNGWREGLTKHTKRTDTCYLSGIDNAAQVYEGSLTMTVCAWIERTEDWEDRWNSVLERIPKSAFLQRGYNGFIPTLAWMFARSKRNVIGLERVLAGHYDAYTNEHRPGPSWSPDEGV